MPHFPRSTSAAGYARLKPMTVRIEAGGVRGGALIELLFILPVLLIMVTAILTIGRLIWQMQLLTDAAKHGARVGVYQSDQVDMACQDIGAAAEEAADEYLTANAERWQLGTIWQTSATSALSAKLSPTYRFYGMKLKLIKVNFCTATTGNCLFCAYSFLEMLAKSASAAMDVNFLSGCTNDTSGETCGAGHGECAPE